MCELKRRSPTVAAASQRIPLPARLNSARRLYTGAQRGGRGVNRASPNDNSARHQASKVIPMLQWRSLAMYITHGTIRFASIYKKKCKRAFLGGIHKVIEIQGGLTKWCQVKVPRHQKVIFSKLHWLIYCVNLLCNGINELLSFFSSFF